DRARGHRANPPRNGLGREGGGAHTEGRSRRLAGRRGAERAVGSAPGIFGAETLPLRSRVSGPGAARGGGQPRRVAERSLMGPCAVLPSRGRVQLHALLRRPARDRSRELAWVVPPCPEPLLRWLRIPPRDRVRSPVAQGSRALGSSCSRYLWRSS